MVDHFWRVMRSIQKKKKARAADGSIRAESAGMLPDRNRGAGGRVCADRVLAGPASGEKGSNGRY